MKVRNVEMTVRFDRYVADQNRGGRQGNTLAAFRKETRCSKSVTAEFAVHFVAVGTARVRPIAI